MPLPRNRFLQTLKYVVFSTEKSTGSTDTYAKKVLEMCLCAIRWMLEPWHELSDWPKNWWKQWGGRRNSHLSLGPPRCHGAAVAPGSEWSITGQAIAVGRFQAPWVEPTAELEVRCIHGNFPSIRSLYYLGMTYIVMCDAHHAGMGSVY